MNPQKQEIHMNDFGAEPKELRSHMLAAVQRVIESGWFVLGNELKIFEDRWARACRASECIGVANGMDAIEIGLRCLGIGPGDEVITSPMTAFATVLGVLRAGATPVLADIDPESGLLCPESVHRCMGPRCKAVMPVHLYGQIRDMDRWRELCGTHSVLMIEDCAQSHLARWQGRAAGTFGEVGAFSFYPTKNLGALGDAGALITSCERTAEHARILRNYGQSARYLHPIQGLNSRLDEMQAAILSARMDWLERFTAQRRNVAQLYREGIDNPLIELLAPPQEAEAHVYHLFVVRCARRDLLQSHLASRGIHALIHYPVPIHHQKACPGLRRDPLGLVCSERHAQTCISLPCHAQIGPEQVRAVIDACNDYREI